MIGHRQILDARANGRKPAAIFFEIGSPSRAPTARSVGRYAGSLHEALYDPEAALASGQYPTVYIEPGEQPDLRFCIGCAVLVSAARWSEDLILTGHAIADAGASVVVVSAMSDSDDLMVFDGKWSAS